LCFPSEYPFRFGTFLQEFPPKFLKNLNRSLKSINPNDGTSKMFEFAVNDKIQPTMKISSPSETKRLFTWDPATKQIVSDNDWKYNITPHSDKMSNAAIGRTNGNDKSEYWYDDVSRGLLIMVGPDGIKKEQKRFTSGILNGRIRSEEYSKGDKIVQTYQATYDESGHLLRQQWVADGKQTENRFDYDSNGHCTNAYRNGQKLCSYIWENGKLTEKIYANGNKLIIKPSTINKTISTIPNGNAVQ